MSGPSGVIVVSQDEQVIKSAREAIAASDQFVPRGVCRSLDDLLIVLDRTDAAVILVDIDPKPEQTLSELDSIVSRHPNARFVAISKQQDANLILQAMQAGVRHYMLSTSIRAELAGVLQRLVPSAVRRNGWHGHLATVLSAGGGCGATTLAVNLADELHRLIASPVLLIDLDEFAGGAAGHLGVRAQYSIADVLCDGDRLDTHLLRSTAVAHHEHLHVLASPATVDFNQPATMNYQHLGKALQRVREVYSFAVVDAPRVPMHVAGLLSIASVTTFIVFEMNVEHIRVARLIYGSLTALGVADQNIIALANRYRGRRDMISLDEAKRAIGCGRIAQLSNDYSSAQQSINYGRPLASDWPRSPLRQDILNLARQLQTDARTHKTDVLIGGCRSLTTPADH